MRPLVKRMPKGIITACHAVENYRPKRYVVRLPRGFSDKIVKTHKNQGGLF